MKKFLSLLTMALLCASVWAATVTYNFSTAAGLQELGIAVPEQSAATNLTSSYTLGDVTLTSTNGSTATRVWNSQGTTDLRIYNNGGSITLSVSGSQVITQVVFTSANNSTGNLSPDAGALTEGTWSGSSASLTFTAGGTTRISTIEVTYGDAAAATVAAPVITFDLDKPFAGDEVTATITCATEGATIQYALNDGEFQDYTGRLTLTETTTVKAKGVLASAATAPIESPVTTKTITFGLSVQNIAEMNQLTSNTEFKLLGQVTVVYVNGQYLYITDDTGWSLIFGTPAEGIESGNTLYNLIGKVNIFRGLFEVTNATYNFDPTQTTVEPNEYGLDEITAANMNEYIIVKGVTLSDVSGRNMTLNDAAGNTLPAYSQYFCEFPEDLEATYDVVGFGAMFNNTVQIYPVSFTVSEEPEAVITVNPDFGEYDGPQTVKVTIENRPADTAVKYCFIEDEDPSGNAPRKAVGDFAWQDYDDNAGIVVNKSGTLYVGLFLGEEMIAGIEGRYTINEDLTAIDGVTTGKTVKTMRYYNVAGQQTSQATAGVNVVVTEYSDGTTRTVKVVK